MYDVIKEVLAFLMQGGYSLYTIVLVMTMSTFIFIVLCLLKKPIKALTKRIKNERIRKLANKTIIILAFALSVLLWFLASLYAPKYFTFDVVEVVLSGALPVVMYAIGDGIITPKSAVAIISKIADVVADGEVTDQEVEETKQIIQEVKNKKSAGSDKTSSTVEAEEKSEAEKLLEDLLKK